MKFVVISFCILFFAQDIPYKAKDEFELILDFEFKPRPRTDKIDFSIPQPSTPLPYLSIRLNVLKLLEDEYRVRVQDTRGNVLTSKQLSRNTTVNFELGYTDDLKDGVAAHKYFIKFYDRQRDVKRQIVISFDKDGTYKVNDEVRGKI